MLRSSLAYRACVPALLVDSHRVATVACPTRAKGLTIHSSRTCFVAAPGAIRYASARRRPLSQVGLTQALGLMKKAIIVLLCLALSFVVGWLCAKQSLYFSSMEYSNAMMRFNAEMQVVFASSNIRSASKGDTSTIIRLNCLRAKSSLRLVDPYAYDDPKKQRAVAKIRDDGLAMIKELTSAGKCGPTR